MAEKTFREYTPDQGKEYALSRLDYHPKLYDTIINHHKSTGGQLNALLDVGCGPGNVAAALSKHFTQTTGLDPSEGMIKTARAISGKNGAIRFEVSTAEYLGSNSSSGGGAGGGVSPPIIADASIDLITAATAAHWFDMPSFWRAAARVLKPGGTVAIWGSGNMRVDPGTPNAEAIQGRIDQFEEEIRPYFLLGNFLTRDLYRDLGLPWSVEPAVEGFEEAEFWRKDYETTEEFLAVGAPMVDLEAFERMLGTMSPVTRWREDHPGAEGTEGDVVRKFRRDLERLLRDSGVEGGQERLKGSAQGFLLVVKRK